MASTFQTHSSKVILTLLALLMMVSSAFARLVTEQEPNNGFTQANSIACSDTVLCANVTVGSGDFFSFLAPGGDSIYIRTFSCGANTNTVLLLYDASFELLAINDNGGPGLFSEIGAFLPFSQLCYLQIAAVDSLADGDYSLSITCQFVGGGAHDLCTAARPISFFPYYDESSTFACGSEGGTLAPDVFYQLTLATPGDVVVQVCSQAFNSRVQLMGGCVFGYMDDSDAGVCQLGADLLLFGLQAQTYYIMVEGVAADQFGDFTIEVLPLLADCPEPHDLKIFDVGGFPFLDWIGVPEADYYLVEQATSGQGPFEALALTSETFWQDPLGFSLTRRFYRVRSVCE